MVAVMSSKEFVQTLVSIRRDCLERNCKNCPCRLNENDCMIAHAWPQNWLLPEEEES